MYTIHSKSLSNEQRWLKMLVRHAIGFAVFFHIAQPPAERDGADRAKSIAAKAIRAFVHKNGDLTQ